MIEALRDTDQRNYEVAVKTIEQQGDLNAGWFTERKEARSQALMVFLVLGGGVLLLTGIVTSVLLWKDQFQLAMTGLTLAAGLLGGTGILTLVQKIVRD